MIILVLIRTPPPHMLIAGSNWVTQLPEPLVHRGSAVLRAS